MFESSNIFWGNETDNIDNGKYSNDIDIEKGSPEDTNLFSFIRKNTKKNDFGPIDMLNLLILFYISNWTRTMEIQYPKEIVFDEVYFGSFVNSYINGEYFFDIHPPTAKLLLSLFGSIYQYNGDINFSEKAYSTLHYISLRHILASFGSYCSPLIFLSCRYFGFTKFGSLLAGIMIICENSMITEAQFILSDSILHFFTCLSIFTLSLVNFYCPFSIEWYISSVANGIAIGLACSSKFTALSLCPLCAYVHIKQMVNKMETYNSNKNIKYIFIDLTIRCLLSIIPVVFVFFASNIIHIIALPYHGTTYDEAFIPKSMRNNLINKSIVGDNWQKRTSPPGIFKRIFVLNKVMHRANMGIKNQHPYSSKWYQWPFLCAKWIWFGNRFDGRIYCLTQPFNTFIGTLSIIFWASLLTIWTKISKNYKKALIKSSTFVIGFLCSYIPFGFVPRVLFIYHYIIPLIFSILAYVSLVEFALKEKIFVRMILETYSMIFTIVAFLYWAPATYGRGGDARYLKWSRFW